MKTKRLNIFNVLYCLCFILFLSLSVAVFSTALETPFSAADSYWKDYASTFNYENNYNSATGYYEIRTAEEFAGFAKTVNNGTTYSGSKIRLMNNIDLSGKEWDPIGEDITFGTDAQFSGTFDGQNCAISGLTITLSSSLLGPAGALFGYVNNGTIQNIVIDSGSIKASDSVAAIVKVANSTKIINCTNRASVESTGSFASGIAFSASNGSKIINCTNYGLIKGVNAAAGICLSLSDSTIDGCINFKNVTSDKGYYVGGIAANIISSTITYCANYGDVSIGNSSIDCTGDAGGIVGSASSSTVSYCYNNSYVKALKSNDSNTGIKTDACAGGIVGNGASSTVSNCFSEGYVTCYAGTYSHEASSISLEYLSEKITDSLTVYFYFQYLMSYNCGGIIGNVLDSNSVSNCGYSSTLTKTDLTQIVFIRYNSKPTYTSFDYAITIYSNNQYRVYWANSTSNYTTYSNYTSMDVSFSYGNTWFDDYTAGAFGSYTYDYYYSGLRIVYSSDAKTSPINIGDNNTNNIQPMWWGSQYPNFWIFRKTSTWKDNAWDWVEADHWVGSDYEEVWNGIDIYAKSLKSILGTADTINLPINYLGSSWKNSEIFNTFVANKILW